MGSTPGCVSASAEPGRPRDRSNSAVALRIKTGGVWLYRCVAVSASACSARPYLSIAESAKRLVETNDELARLTPETAKAQRAQGGPPGDNPTNSRAAIGPDASSL